MPAGIDDIEIRYAKLKAQYENGGFKYDDYVAAVNALRIQDENGIYLQIRADDGKWVRWDSSTWIPCERPGPGSPVDMGDQAQGGAPVQRSGPEGPGPGLETSRFLTMLGKGMATGFVRHIPLMAGTMALVWFINLVLIVMVKKGAITGDPHPLIASILILPGQEAAGLMFWGLLVGLAFSIASKIRHGKLSGTIKKISGTPGFIRSSFDAAGFYSVFLVLIGFFASLFIAGMVSNVLVSIQLAILMCTTLIAQEESLLAKFLQVIGSDFGRTLYTASYTGERGVSWSVAVMAGAFAGFAFSFLLPVSLLTAPFGIACLVTGGVFVVMVLVSGKGVSNR